MFYIHDKSEESETISRENLLLLVWFRAKTNANENANTKWRTSQDVYHRELLGKTHHCYLQFDAKGSLSVYDIHRKETQR